MEVDAKSLPNGAERRLTIGVLTYGMQHTICYDLWKGIHIAAREHDANLLMLPGDHVRCPFGDFREQANIIYECANWETVDGLLIWGGALFQHLDAEEVRRFCARYAPLPIVCMSHVLPDIPSVVMGNYQAMRDLLVHLIEAHGYQRIAFMRGPVKAGSEADERYQAYCDVLREYDLPYDPDLVLLGNNEKLPAAAAMRDLLKSGLRPPKNFEAIAASNDVMALAVLDVFQEYGIRVPQDAALAGFDDVGPARAATPPLTTVRNTFETLGFRAAKVLLSKLLNSPLASSVDSVWSNDAPQPVVVPLDVVIRQSCGCQDSRVVRAAVFPQQVETLRPNQIPASLKPFVKTPTGSNDILDNPLEQVVNAFHNEFQAGSSGQFLAALQEALIHTSAKELDVEVWQDVVSAMRSQYGAALSEKNTAQAENLCQQARVMIGQTARRVQEAKRLRMAEQEQHLRAIGARLLATFEMDRLMGILAEELPGLGIPCCYLTMYDNPLPYAYPQSIAHWHARLLLAYHAAAPHWTEEPPISRQQSFPAHRLVPRAALPAEHRYDFVVMPLYFRKRQIGVTMFEGAPREGTMYHALRTEISSALQGALLIEQVQQNAIEIIRQKSILDTFMATVPDAIYFKDREGRITQANQAHAGNLGYQEPGEEIGKTDFDFFPVEQARRRWEQEQAILRTGEPLMELEEAGMQGRWVLTTKMPLRDGQGNIVGIFGISRDITTLKQTEQELRRYQDHLEELVKERTVELTRTNASLKQEILERRRAEKARRAGEEQYRMLAEHVKDGILIVQHSAAVFANTALADMLGYSETRIFQRELDTVLPGYIVDSVQHQEPGEDTPQQQVELRDRDGRSIWTEIEQSSIVWNTESAVLLTVRNVTQAKLREMRLEEERTRLQQENLTFRSAGTERYRFGPLIGKSPAMQRVYELIVSAATSGINVLVSGESGTGKELIARTIHRVSARKSKAFVPVNCASIPETLFEREFFGHTRGSFTGADRDKAGLFDLAHRGILFLDEVTELTPGMQAKLLRVLQDGEYLPLGSNRLKKADFVIVAATNKDCRKEIAAGGLRQDFFYRIGVIEIQSPPLRDRKDDLALLIEALLEQYGQKHPAPAGHVPLRVSELPAELMQALYAYDWPGNVRELQNILHRFLATRQLADILALLGGSSVVRSIAGVPEAATETSATGTLDEAVSALEKRLIRDTLARTNNNKSETARRLHITRRTLRLKMQKYQLNG